MSADGRLAVSASDDDTLKVWDVERGLDLRTLEGHSDAVLGVAISGNGRAASASWDKTLKVWDVNSGVQLATFTCEAFALSCAFIIDHDLIVAGDAGGHVHFLRLEEPKPKS